MGYASAFQRARARERVSVSVCLSVCVSVFPTVYMHVCMCVLLYESINISTTFHPCLLLVKSKSLILLLAGKHLHLNGYK